MVTAAAINQSGCRPPAMTEIASLAVRSVRRCVLLPVRLSVCLRAQRRAQDFNVKWSNSSVSGNRLCLSRQVSSHKEHSDIYNDSKTYRLTHRRRRRGVCPPPKKKKSGKYFLAYYHLKFGHFSAKYVKFWNFVNFRANISFSYVYCLA